MNRKDLEKKLEELRGELAKKIDVKKEMLDFVKKTDKPDCCIIICDEGEMIAGNTVDIQTMLAKVVNSLKEKGVPDCLIQKAVEIGLMSDEEREQEVERAQQEDEDLDEELEGLKEIKEKLEKLKKLLEDA